MSTFLSIIIPAHNEENRLPDTLEQVTGFLSQQSFTSEIIVVENGSNDKTLEVAQAFGNQDKNIRVIQSERGKGAAVRCGMLEAQGEYRFMCDADLSMPVEEIVKFIPLTLTLSGRNCLSSTHTISFPPNGEKSRCVSPCSGSAAGKSSASGSRS